MTKKIRIPQSVEELNTAILTSYENLSQRLQQIAKYVLDEPNDLALETVAVLAKRCGVQPSTIIRFAKHFGFTGASQMQKLYRDRLLSGSGALGYAERIREFNEKTGESQMSGSMQLLSEFIDSNVLGLEHLREDVSSDDLEKAVHLIDRGEMVYIVGFGRAFPICAYLSYALGRLSKRVLFIDGVGGGNKYKASAITQKDILIVVSFAPYSDETMEVVEMATNVGCKIISISDSQINPIALQAEVSFKVKDGEVRKFRSLSVSMCLAQALVVGYAFECLPNYPS